MGDGYTRRETDFLGNEIEVHYDSSGKKVGETRFTIDVLGNPKQEHYSADNEKTGETRRGSDFLGRDRAEHYDKHGNLFGYSKNESDMLGNPVQRHYDSRSWEHVGESRAGTDFLGRPRKEHSGDYHKAHSTEVESSEEDSSDNTDTDEGSDTGYSYSSSGYEPSSGTLASGASYAGAPAGNTISRWPVVVMLLLVFMIAGVYWFRSESGIDTPSAAPAQTGEEFVGLWYNGGGDCVKIERVAKADHFAVSAWYCEADDPQPSNARLVGSVLKGADGELTMKLIGPNQIEGTYRYPPPNDDHLWERVKLERVDHF